MAEVGYVEKYLLTKALGFEGARCFVQLLPTGTFSLAKMSR
jgi:hypothetical protein